MRRLWIVLWLSLPLLAYASIHRGKEPSPAPTILTGEVALRSNPGPIPILVTEGTPPAQWHLQGPLASALARFTGLRVRVEGEVQVNSAQERRIRVRAYEILVEP